MHTQDFYITTRDGLKLHVKSYGETTHSDETIVCLHGLTRNLKDFSLVAPWLAAQKYNSKTTHVLCLSFRGRGQSARDETYINYQPAKYVEDVVDLLDSQNLKNAIFVGTSLGGIVTMMLADQYPEKIRAAVLNDIGPELAPEGLARIGSYVGTHTPVKTWEEAATRIKEINGVAFPDADDAFWHRFANNTFRETDQGLELDYDPTIAKALIEAGSAPDMWPMFDHMACPILSVRGALSDLFTEDIQSRMLSRNQNCQKIIIPNVGHAPMLEEETAKRAIHAFFRGLIS